MIRTLPRRRGAAVVATLAALAYLASACTSPAPGPTTSTTTTTIAEPTAPVVEDFAVRGGVGPAPAVVAMGWRVSDPNGDALRCRLVATGGVELDLEVDPCPTEGSRNLSLPVSAPVQVSFEVDDGTFVAVGPARTLHPPAGPGESFELELRGAADLDPDLAELFDDAAARWQELIVRGIPDVPTIARPGCLPAGAPDLPSPVDDVIIDVAVEPIDGPGNVLGQAGPTCISLADELPLHGVMTFDSADVAVMAAGGTLDAVILHEMGHVLGIGTLWDLTSGGVGSRRVISGAGGADPRFTGPRGVAEFGALGGTGTVPVESLGGPGTRDAHWRESVFGDELLTGWIDVGPNPLSRLSVASLADMGYQVDLSATDDYVLPGGAAALRSSRAADTGRMLRPQVGAVTPGP